MRQMSSSLPPKAWFLTGAAMLCSLHVGVLALRSLGAAGASRRGRNNATRALASSSTAPSSSGGTKGRDLANLRENYMTEGLVEGDVPDEPYHLMDKWIDEACNCKQIIEPNAMCLSTVGEGGRPSARFVLMKGFDKRGITWFTNYNSRKAQELKKSPHAAITFWWGALQRSVRIEGEVEMVSEAESDEYFNCRPTGSKIGAWVSDQSQPVGSREELDTKAKEIEEAFASEGNNVPRPPHWGGFRLRPLTVEFWEGQPSRLHDRLVYSKTEGGGGGGHTWQLTRLQP